MVDMSWIEHLYETYERCAGRGQDGEPKLLPVAHTSQLAHIEVMIDGKGNFRRAQLLDRELTVIPATEKSAGRTSGQAPHPLCDKLQYCAGDYSVLGGLKESYYEAYAEQLASWCASEYAHPKAIAINIYTRKKKLIADLIGAGCLAVKNRRLQTLEKAGLKDRKAQQELHPIFRLLTAKDGRIDQGDALVRWRVEEIGIHATGTWEDTTLIAAWQKFDLSQRKERGFCMVTGEEDSVIALQHPARLRNGADKAKLISSNDNSGFTYRGRFLDASEVAGVSYSVSQKAHSALRWLIERKHAFRNGDQVFVSWATTGKPIPDPMANTLMLFAGVTLESVHATESTDVGQAFAARLARAMAGYRAYIDDSDRIAVMGLDSATPGRLSITLYRELTGSAFLQRIQDWHQRHAWRQNFGKDHRFEGAPAPRDIAEVAFGRRLDDKLRKVTVERLMPCIIDGERVPRDLVTSCVRRASNPAGIEPWEWEKAIGVACALFRGFNNDRRYAMTIETSRRSRDYLYGRLLATADHLERIALYVAGENRETTATRLMQRFAARPCSTWRTIELALAPYKARLRSSRTGFLYNMESLVDEIVAAFPAGPHSFTDDSPLSGEFLLGYHCQRHDLRALREKEINETVA